MEKATLVIRYDLELYVFRNHEVIQYLPSPNFVATFSNVIRFDPGDILTVKYFYDSGMSTPLVAKMFFKTVPLKSKSIDLPSGSTQVSFEIIGPFMWSCRRDGAEQRSVPVSLLGVNIDDGPFAFEVREYIKDSTKGTHSILVVWTTQIAKLADNGNAIEIDDNDCDLTTYDLVVDESNNVSIRQNHYNPNDVIQNDSKYKIHKKAPIRGGFASVVDIEKFLSETKEKWTYDYFKRNCQHFAQLFFREFADENAATRIRDVSGFQVAGEAVALLVAQTTVFQAYDPLDWIKLVSRVNERYQKSQEIQGSAAVDLLPNDTLLKVASKIPRSAREKYQNLSRC